jgi:hypothetical protein
MYGRTKIEQVANYIIAIASHVRDFITNFPKKDNFFPDRKPGSKTGSGYWTGNGRESEFHDYSEQ